MTEALTLVSHHLCPYVQRAAIALTEKNVSFTRVPIDLGHKPDWFKAISPLGKVPLLRVASGPEAAEVILFESAPILEYLEETQPAPLHPGAPLDRARHRAWIEFGSSILSDIAGFYAAPDSTAFRTKTEALRGKFVRVEAALGDGPWFAGERFSLVDAVYGPIFRYFDIFDGIGDFGVLSELPRLAHWRSALSERPSIRDAVDADYPDRLRCFLHAKDAHLSRLMAA